jgi:hypothetical protein
MKLRGENELVVTPTEDQEGKYYFGLALEDVNPFPFFETYTVILNVKSQWPGRPKISKTLNATISALNCYSELLITFNEDIQIIPNFINQTN